MNLVLTKTAAETALGVSLPHRRMEDWRWTDLRQLIDQPYPPRQKVEAKPADIARLLKSSPFAAIAATRMVFVNGALDTAHSKLANGAAASHAVPDEPVIAMNTAFADDGARLQLSGTADTPIELVFITTNGAARAIATRNVIEIAAGSSVTLIETHLGEGDYLSNSVTEIRVGEGARLDRVKVEHEAANAVHLSHTHVTLAKNARLNDFTLTSGARLNRQNGTYVFAGQGAEARVSGAYLLAGKQHADTRLVVDHQVPHCLCRELFKCVMDDHCPRHFPGQGHRPPRCPEDRWQAVEPRAAAVRTRRIRRQARTRNLRRRRGLRPWRHLGRFEPRSPVLSQIARHSGSRSQVAADRRLRGRSLRDHRP